MMGAMFLLGIYIYIFKVHYHVKNHVDLTSFAEQGLPN